MIRILLDNALRHTPEETLVTVTTEASGASPLFTVAQGGAGLGLPRETPFTLALPVPGGGGPR